VMFNMHELAEWVGNWAPRPVTVTDIACATCGKEGVRLVVEGEPVSKGAVYCATCRPKEEGRPGPRARRLAPRLSRYLIRWRMSRYGGGRLREPRDDRLDQRNGAPQEGSSRTRTLGSHASRVDPKTTPRPYG
jgi:hypothetical protein